MSINHTSPRGKAEPIRNMDGFKCVDADRLKLRLPYTAVISGSTCCGKTTFLAKLLEYRNQMFHPAVERVIYSYKKWQEIFERMPDVEFVKGMDFELDKSKRTLLIIDDQINDDALIGNQISDLFCVGAHHDNCSVMLVTQNLFHQSKSFRTAALNAMYLFLFKSPRGSNQVAHLARQIYTGGKAKEMVRAYECATEKPFSYLMVDLRPDTEPELRFRTNILPCEGETFTPGEDCQDVRLTKCYLI